MALLGGGGGGGGMYMTLEEDTRATDETGTSPAAASLALIDSDWLRKSEEPRLNLTLTPASRLYEHL